MRLRRESGPSRETAFLNLFSKQLLLLSLIVHYILSTIDKCIAMALEIQNIIPIIQACKSELLRPRIPNMPDNLVS